MRVRFRWAGYRNTILWHWRVARRSRAAHRKAIAAEFPEVVCALVALAGRKLTVYVASIKDTRAIDGWLRNVTPRKNVEHRIRLTYHVAAMLAPFNSPSIVQAWLTGLNPELNDHAPATLLRDGDIEVDGKRILAVARKFVSGGWN